MSENNNYVTSTEYESGVGILKIYSDSVSPALKIKEVLSSTITISACNAPSSLQIGDSGASNELQVNSIWLSDLEITIGTTTTLPAGSAATVVNTGTSKKAILNFGIPRGEKGEAGGSVWGNIAGDITDQEDLQTQFAAKQETLVSGVNIKTINNQSILGEGNIEIQGGGILNLDGGTATSVYTIDQVVDGGNASGNAA